MARLEEDSSSDFEFPDVKDLLDGKRAVPVRRAKAAATQVAALGNVKAGRGRGLGGVQKDVDVCVGEENFERSVRKKRVLAKRDDNPLLRPLGRKVKEERARGAKGVKKVGLSVGQTGLSRKKVGESETGKGAEVDGRPEESLVRKGKVEAGTAALEKTRELAVEPIAETAPGFANFPKAFPQERGQERKLGDTFKGALEDQSCEKGSGMDWLDWTQRDSIRKRFQSKAVAIGSEDGEGDSGMLEGFSGTKQDDELSSGTAETGQVPRSRISKQMKPARQASEIKTSSKMLVVSIDSDDEDLIPTEQSPKFDLSRAPKSRKRAPPPKPKSRFILTDTEEEDSEEDEDDEGMSDFIVSDHESVEGDSSLMEIPPPPPRSVRKLVKGRRRRSTSSEDEGLDLKMGRLKVDDDDVSGHAENPAKRTNSVQLDDSEDDEPPLKSATKSSRTTTQKAADLRKPPFRKEKVTLPPSSDIEDPFTLRFSPSENKLKPSKATYFTTPPSSPKLLPRLVSPTKAPRIPTSPHRQSSDAFWAPDVVNEWNDEYSPPKTLKTPRPALKPLGPSTLPFSPAKEQVPRLTKETKKAFSQTKHSLAEDFLRELDERITQGKIAEMAACTGGVKIIWSKKLNTTAGRANWKRETLRPKPLTSSSSTSTSSSSHSTPAPSLTHRHHAAIELAEKVIDDEDRLLNVLAHEFCHLANFMISNMKTNPHGKEFKAWASKVSVAFGHRGIEVTTKHSYEIEYKYVWECENCGTAFKRHSKSIDPARHRCGACKCLLLQTKPVPRAGAGEGKGKGGLGEYQMFVKDNMARVRSENPGSPQREIMGLVGKKYQEHKASKLGVGSAGEGERGMGSKDSTPVDDVVDVARKLDFLDLTSP